MMTKLIILLLASANLLAYAMKDAEVTIDKSKAVGPGFRQLTPEEFRAHVPSLPSRSNNKEPLPQFPDFGLSFQAADLDKQRREREQKERDDSLRKQQDDLRKLQDDLKRSQDDLKRQQEDHRRKQEEEKRRQEEEKNKREETKRRHEKDQRKEQERKQTEDNLRRQIQELNNRAHAPPARIPVEQKKPVDPPKNKKKEDEENKKKENNKKDDEKKDEKDDKKPPNKTERGQVPKRNGPKKPVGGRLSGRPPGQGKETELKDQYRGSSYAYNLSPSAENFMLAMFLLLALI